jgi:hypothetical protein
MKILQPELALDFHNLWIRFWGAFHYSRRDFGDLCHRFAILPSRRLPLRRKNFDRNGQGKAIGSAILPQINLSLTTLSEKLS